VAEVFELPFYLMNFINSLQTLNTEQGMIEVRRM